MRQGQGNHPLESVYNQTWTRKAAGRDGSNTDGGAGAFDAIRSTMTAPELKATLEAHSGVVTGVAYIDKDDVFITSSVDQSVAIWRKREHSGIMHAWVGAHDVCCKRGIVRSPLPMGAHFC